MTSLREKLEEELQQIEWQHLQPHNEREALVVVSQELNLLDVAVAFAEDDTENVKKWMAFNLVYKPGAAQTSSYADNKVFKFIIVQPFVLVQELAN